VYKENNGDSVKTNADNKGKLRTNIIRVDKIDFGPPGDYQGKKQITQKIKALNVKLKNDCF
jgi:hypothetical protein